MNIKRIISTFTVTCFIFANILGFPVSSATGQEIGLTLPNGISLPIPGTPLELTKPFNPLIIEGITLYPTDPFRFDFLINPGDEKLSDQNLHEETDKLVKYFLASLTVPTNHMWVNLSPTEKDRIIPNDFGETQLGRDLLAQDYLLKQLAASLIMSQNHDGKKFWERLQTVVYEKFGTKEIPLDFFNRIWIIPEKAEVYVKNNTVFVVDSHLKVLLEDDYLRNKNTKETAETNNTQAELSKNTRELSTAFFRQEILPLIEKEVNEGKTFTNLRQIYQAMILATWFKHNLQKSWIGQGYANKAKTDGIALDDPKINQKIYNQYLESFKQGVHDYIKEEYDPTTQEMISKHYFTGRVDATNLALTASNNASNSWVKRMRNVGLSLLTAGVTLLSSDGKLLSAQETNFTNQQAAQTIRDLPPSEFTLRGVDVDVAMMSSTKGNRRWLTRAAIGILTAGLFFLPGDVDPFFQKIHVGLPSRAFEDNPSLDITSGRAALEKILEIRNRTRVSPLIPVAPLPGDVEIIEFEQNVRQMLKEYFTQTVKDYEPGRIYTFGVPNDDTVENWRYALNKYKSQNIYTNPGLIGDANFMTRFIQVYHELFSEMRRRYPVEGIVTANDIETWESFKSILETDWQSPYAQETKLARNLRKFFDGPWGKYISHHVNHETSEGIVTTEELLLNAKGIDPILFTFVQYILDYSKDFKNPTQELITKIQLQYSEFEEKLDQINKEFLIPNNLYIEMTPSVPTFFIPRLGFNFTVYHIEKKAIKKVGEEPWDIYFVRTLRSEMSLTESLDQLFNPISILGHTTLENGRIFINMDNTDRAAFETWLPLSYIESSKTSRFSSKDHEGPLNNVINDSAFRIRNLKSWWLYRSMRGMSYADIKREIYRSIINHEVAHRNLEESGINFSLDDGMGLSEDLLNKTTKQARKALAHEIAAFLCQIYLDIDPHKTLETLLNFLNQKPNDLLKDTPNSSIDELHDKYYHAAYYILNKLSGADRESWVDGSNEDASFELFKKLLTDPQIREKAKALVEEAFPGLEIIDGAMTAKKNKKDNVGGIDLDEAYFQINEHGDMFEFQTPSPAQLQFRGIKPVIKSITPTPNPLQLLGISNLISSESTKSARIN